MIEHVWFDTSGTLYRETPEFEEAHNDYLFGIMASITGESDRQRLQSMYHNLLEQHGSNSAVFAALGMPVDYWQKKFEEFDANSLLRPNTEIIDTLNQLKDQVPISVFTNLRVNKLQDMLKHLDIPIDDFTHVLSAVDVGNPKPHPEGFHKMVELSGIDPARILMSVIK